VLLKLLGVLNKKEGKFCARGGRFVRGGKRQSGKNRETGEKKKGSRPKITGRVGGGKEIGSLNEAQGKSFRKTRATPDRANLNCAHNKKRRGGGGGFTQKSGGREGERSTVKNIYKGT